MNFDPVKTNRENCANNALHIGQPLDVLARAVRFKKRAFTLVEIMIVVALIGMMAAMGAPAFIKAMRKEGMNKATSDLMEACKQARATAILSGHPAQLIFQPTAGHFSAGKISATIPPNVHILSLGINFVEYTDADYAAVTFYQTGTSDEFEITLQDDTGEMKMVFLDIVTGCALVKDPR